MLTRGRVYVNVLKGYKAEIVDINHYKEQVKLRVTEYDRTWTDVVNISSFQWAIDRKDYLPEKTVNDIDRWMIQSIEKVLPKIFGVRTGLQSLEPLILKATIKSIADKTGFREDFLYSMLPTLRKL